VNLRRVKCVKFNTNFFTMYSRYRICAKDELNISEFSERSSITSQTQFNNYEVKFLCEFFILTLNFQTVLLKDSLVKRTIVRRDGNLFANNVSELNMTSCSNDEFLPPCSCKNIRHKRDAIYMCIFSCKFYVA